MFKTCARQTYVAYKTLNFIHGYSKCTIRFDLESPYKAKFKVTHISSVCISEGSAVAACISPISKERIQLRALRYTYNDISLWLCITKGKSKQTTDVYTTSETNNMDHLYHSMNVKSLQQSRFNTVTYGRNSFIYQGAKEWNTLVNFITDTTCLNAFVMLITTWNGEEGNCSYTVMFAF